MQKSRAVIRTSLNVQRIIAALAVSVIAAVGLGTLVYINNLYQPELYLKISIVIYLIILIWMHFIFDLHLKEDHFDANSIAHALRLRFKHFTNWQHFRHFQNYLIMPGLIYWASVILIGINFGHAGLQNFIAAVSSLCLVISFVLFKEIFHSRFAPLKNFHFVMLSYVKIYCAWISFCAALGIVWYYCFSPWVFYSLIFAVSFMLLYQALFQFGQLKFSRISTMLGIALLMSVASFFVYHYWNVNYFTAGLFLTAIYNFCWSLLFHKTNKTLTAGVIIEQLAILALLMVMVFGTTNFDARIGGCNL